MPRDSPDGGGVFETAYFHSGRQIHQQTTIPHVFAMARVPCWKEADPPAQRPEPAGKSYRDRQTPAPMPTMKLGILAITSLPRAASGLEKLGTDKATPQCSVKLGGKIK
jgi:hypothetical protein